MVFLLLGVWGLQGLWLRAPVIRRLRCLGHQAVAIATGRGRQAEGSSEGCRECIQVSVFGRRMSGH